MQENKVVPFENCGGVTLASLASMRAASQRGCRCYGPGNVDRWVGQLFVLMLLALLFPCP